MSGPDRAGSADAATFVYGVTPADAPALDVAGIADGAVRIVAGEALGALVSEVDRIEVESARAVRAYSRVLDAAIAAGPVVPLRFGTMVADDDAVKSEVLGPYRDRFHELLERLGQHVELKVKVAYDEDAIVRQLVAAEPAIAARHERIAGVDDDAAYYARIELGEEVAASLEARRDRDAAAVYDALCDVADDVRTSELLNPHMVVNGTFLVRRDGLDAFQAAILAATRDHPEMQVRLIGPLPPYSFSDVELVG
jgi:Gas vesicle synthesis protein GvpL/GvpF